MTSAATAARASAPDNRTRGPLDRWLPWVGLVIRLGMGAGLLYAGLPKAVHVDRMVSQVKLYQLLPDGLVHPVAYAVPALEVVVGVLLVLGYATRTVAAIACLMLLAYIGAIVSVDVRGIKIDCGCFSAGGVVEVTHYGRDYLRDGLMFLVTALLVWRPRTKFALAAADRA
ncbi:MAG: hypothetical protein JWM48_3259 [Mycobacterium sp.]|nr:hypothetical protein [Mycobacterium sp.]